MFSKAVCRTCLATNIRMLDLRSTRLRDVFEKLTSTKVERHSKICYICFSQLERCRRFLDMTAQADRVFQLCANGFELIPNSVPSLRASHNFICTPIECISLPEASEPLLPVKIELPEVKEESESGLYDAVKLEDPAEDFMNISRETFIDKEGKLDAHNNYTDEDDSLEFPNISSLKDHVTDYMACDFCNKKFSDKLELQRHTRKHTKPFTCNICRKSFSEQSSLKKHAVSHGNDRPFICEHCLKSFTHKTYLIQHIRSHTGEKPFICEVCNKTFSQIGHLSIHKRTHYTNKEKKQLKQHKCSVCFKTFINGSGLNRHMKTHTGLKSYSCEICTKSFAAQDTLNSHVRSHAGDRPYKCTDCGKAFLTRGNLVKHMKLYAEHQMLK